MNKRLNLNCSTINVLAILDEILSKYLKLFKKLRIDRSHGNAPHKPILLLTVLELYRKGLILDEKIYITPELITVFRANWNVLVVTNHECRISYPFYHLNSEKFWHLVPNGVLQDINQIHTSVKSLFRLNAYIAYAAVDADFVLLAKDKDMNQLLTNFLLAEYFPITRNHYSLVSINANMQFEELEQKMLHDSPEKYKREIKALLAEKNEEEVFIRGSLFKREIPKIYNNTCCISRMKVETVTNISMIDACHIVPFSISYDDTVTNGIALCPNLHRAFDRGLIAIDDNFKVMVSKVFAEEQSNYSLKVFEGKRIQLPKIKSYYPMKENLEWHRGNVFK